MAHNFLDTLFDKAASVYSKVIDTDLRKFELQLIKQAQAENQAAVVANAPIGRGLPDLSQYLPLVIVAGVGFGLYRLLR